MNDKTRKILKIIGWAMALGGTALLLVLGFTVEEVNAGILLVDGVVVAVGLLITFILGKIKAGK